MHQLISEIEQRLDTMFAALAAGADLPPSQRLRTEGMLESAALLAIASPEELVAIMERRYGAAFGRTLAEDLGEDWREFFPFPQIPAMARRAPVYPTTSD